VLESIFHFKWIAAVSCIGTVCASHATFTNLIPAEEDRAFCARFGAGPETGRHTECAAALKVIRARHEERISSEVAGIL
jgi:hypothetical protein